MKKAVIYARYSSERQTEQSIEGQLTVCKKFARDNGFVILDEYIDRAMTGTNDNRLAFQKMIRDSARQEWQYVIVYKGDYVVVTGKVYVFYEKSIETYKAILVDSTYVIKED